jgi:hypothetical protein
VSETIQISGDNIGDISHESFRCYNLGVIGVGINSNFVLVGVGCNKLP